MAHPSVAAVLTERATLARYARPCAVALGTELTAYLAGAASVAELDAWLAGADGPGRERALPRLAAVAEVVRIFAADNRVSLVRPWLREVGADGGPPPARSIRVAGDDDNTVKGVVQAAADWVSARRLAGSVLA